MCALIKHPILGELSGKLGGNVFARNGHGAYVRQFTQPINTNTPAQQTARNTFTASSNLYSSLNAVERTAWNEYAKNWFKPRKISRTGKNNGYDAFMSLNQVKRMMVEKLRSGTLKFDGSLPFGELNHCFFDLNKRLPPEKSKSIVYKGVGDTSYTLYCSLFKFAYDGSIRMELENTDKPQGLYLDKMEDVNGNKNGYVIYCSEPKRFKGGFYATPLAKAILYIDPQFPFSTPDPPISFQTIEYEYGADPDRWKYKNYPDVNDWVLITIYSVDCQGQLEQFDSFETQVLYSI